MPPLKFEQNSIYLKCISGIIQRWFCYYLDIVLVYWIYTMACFFMWSHMWSLNRNHMADTTFLNKIVPSINLQKIHQIKIKFKVYNKTTTNSCSIHLWRTHSLFLVGISHSSSRYPYMKTTRGFFTDILNAQLFLLYK